MESLRKESVSKTEFESSVSVPMMALSDAEIQQLKDQNQQRVKRVVALVAVAITTIAIILVALSLSLGPKIDQLVSESLESKMSSTELLLGPKRTAGEWADKAKRTAGWEKHQRVHAIRRRRRGAVRKRKERINGSTPSVDDDVKPFGRKEAAPTGPRHPSTTT
uniref:Col_cuticle_N domain-containing protein n=1 Tax=Globodera pallida TaxID=36090 RepID=A0A183BL62_GLOPA